MDLYFKSYGAGPPLTILHGLLGAGGNWHTLSSRLFGTKYKTIVVDQRNHGRSPHHPVMDYPSMAEDLVALMARLEIERTHLLGHSMGGKTAMHMALTHPQSVDRLVVVDIAPKAYPPGHLQLLAALSELDPSEYDKRSEIDAALARSIPSNPIRQFLLKNLRMDGPGHYSWQMNLDAITEQYDAICGTVGGDNTFAGPTLFIRGGASPYILDADIPDIRKRFPAAEVITVPGVGHWVHAEAPEAFGRIVMEFLAG